MLRKVVLGSGIIALIPTVNAASPVQDTSGPKKPPPMRPSELPIYDAPHAEYNEYLEAKERQGQSSYLRSALHPPVQAVREQLQSVWSQTESIKNVIKDNYNEFSDRSEWIVQYLREEDNKQTRYGAVAMGGLTGFIFGLRGGFIRVRWCDELDMFDKNWPKVAHNHELWNYKGEAFAQQRNSRIFYAGLGTTAMGYVCFPEETKEIVKDNSALLKQYINIAYNFLYGVKPGDPQLEIKFPELSVPKDLSEFVDMTVSLASTVRQAVMPPPSKDAVDNNKPTEKKD